MSNTLQYLDYEGLKYYDKKLKESLKDYMPEDGVDGKDGLTPTIGSDGYWYIGDKKTEYKAAGKDGVDGAPGKDGAPGQDGKDGVNGRDGASITITSTNKVDGVTTVTFSDGSTININDGAAGKDGVDGDLSDAYEQGADIVIADTDSNGKKNIKVGLSKDFTVVKGLGQYTQGQRIPAGTTLYEIVEKLLGGKLIAAIKSQPSATYSYSPTYSKEYEVGTTVNASITVTPKATGSYTKYNGTTASTSTTTHNVSKNVPASFNGSLTTTQKLQAECVIDSVTVDAKNSDDTTTSLTISQSGSTKSSQIVLTPLMKMFIHKGALSITANGEIDRDILTAQNLVKAGSTITYTNSKGLLDNGYVYFFVPASGALTESCAADKKWRLFADTSKDNGPKDSSKAPITGFEKLTTTGTSAGTPVIVKIKDASETLRDYHVYRFVTGVSTGLGATEVNLQFDYVSTSTAETDGMSYFSI